MPSSPLSLITLLATTAVLVHAGPAAASATASEAALATSAPTSNLEARIDAIRRGPWGPLLGNGTAAAADDATLARAWGNGGGRAWGNGGRRFYGGGGAWGNGGGRGWANGGRPFYGGGAWGNGGGAWGNGGGGGFINW